MKNDRNFKKNKIRTGIIGLGQRGSTLLTTILACDEAEVVALCDVYATEWIPPPKK